MSGYETNVTPSISGFETTTPPASTPSWESLPTAAPQQQTFAPPAAPVGTKGRKPMVAYITIGAAIVIAGFLLFIWLIGVITGIGGSLIHLLLVLALLIGFVGIAVGIFLLVMSKRQ
jgi:predicted lipid-binding transport protein (Tim44 family)